MAKKRKQPVDEGSPAWMTTFSDLMNLLLCFFVLLFASSTVDEGKLQKIAASFNNMSFNILTQGSVSLVDGQIVSGGVTQLPGIESILEYVGKASEATGNNIDQETASSDGDGNSSGSETDNETSVDGNAQENTGSASVEEMLEQMEAAGLNQSEEMYAEIQELMESYSIDDKVVMDYNSQYVQLDLNGAILFESGVADIKDDAKPLMQKISSILTKYKDCIIEIEGHTDNVPINSKEFESNRYLSTARATKVYEYILTQENLVDSNIKIAGYGESRPAASNDTSEGRAKNRRVVIKIYNQLRSEQSLE